MPTHDRFWYIEPVIIGNDVWIGDGAYKEWGNNRRRSHHRSEGSRNEKYPPYAIVAGIPAEVIGYRFDEKTICSLLKASGGIYQMILSGRYLFDDIEKAVEFLASINNILVDGTY
jgi:hypothetical protein